MRREALDIQNPRYADGRKPGAADSPRERAVRFKNDFQTFFRVTPPTVHRMIVTLHERGLIERVPGQPRSITLRLPPDALPPLQSINIPATGY